MRSNQVIIMAGGIGSRFWPMSTPDHPKQFIDVMGVGRSLIQLTVDRLKPICPVENMWVVTNEKYISIVKEQIPDMPVDNILAEPEARNTAPCIAYACWKIQKQHPNANIVVTPPPMLWSSTPQNISVSSARLSAIQPTRKSSSPSASSPVAPRPATATSPLPSPRTLTRYIRWKPSRKSPISPPQSSTSLLATTTGTPVSSCGTSTPSAEPSATSNPTLQPSWTKCPIPSIPTRRKRW